MMFRVCGWKRWDKTEDLDLVSAQWDRVKLLLLTFDQLRAAAMPYIPGSPSLSISTSLGARPDLLSLCLAPPRWLALPPNPVAMGPQRR